MRREFIAGLGSAVAWPLAVQARRIGCHGLQLLPLPLLSRK